MSNTNREETEMTNTATRATFGVFVESYRYEDEPCWVRIGPSFDTEQAAQNYIARHPNQDREYAVLPIHAV